MGPKKRKRYNPSPYQGGLQRHAIGIRCAKGEVFEMTYAVYITARKVRIVSHERVEADGVLIDLPGNIESTERLK